MEHPVQLPHIGAAEEQALLPVALHRLNQGVGDAEGDLRRLAAGHTQGAVLRRDTHALLQTLDQGGAHRAARHPNGAVDDGQILIPGLEKHVLEALGGVALISGDETGGQLDPRRPQPGIAGHILAGEYPAAKTGMGWPYFSS